MSGWSKGRGVRDAQRMNSNEGAFLQGKSACVSPADGLLSLESWGVGAASFACAQGGPFFFYIRHFTSLPPLSLFLCCSLFYLLLFCASLCVSLFLDFGVIFSFFVLLIDSGLGVVFFRIGYFLVV